MVKVPAPKLSVVLTLAVVGSPVMTMVTVPKPAVVDPAAVFVTVTLPTTEEPHGVESHTMVLPAAAGAALLFAK